MKRSTLIIFFLALTAIPKIAFSINNRYVDSLAGNDLNTGASWANAYQSLARAMSAAAADATIDSILVAKGTYYPSANPAAAPRDTAFTILRGGLKLIGGYPSGGGTRNIVSNQVILDGNVGTPATTDNSYHIMVIAGQSATADSIVIDGFTFRNGNANGSGNKTYNAKALSQGTGGAIAVIGCALPYKLHIRNNRFSGNNATNGGAISVNASFPLITDCSFSSNTAATGGAVYCISTSNSIIQNSSFTSNSATNNSLNGGGIYSGSSTTTVTKCTFTSNTASTQFGGGSAIDNNSATALISDCDFLSNSVTGTGTSEYGGTVHSGTGSSVTINRCQLLGNTSTRNGGGVMSSGTLTIANSVLAGNTALRGGGIWTGGSSGTVQIINCGISGNSATERGSVIYTQHNFVSISNCAVWNNNTLSPFFDNDPGGTSRTTIKYSMVPVAAGFSPNINYINGGNVQVADPLFVSAPSHTTAPFTTGDYHLQPASAGINAGDTIGLLRYIGNRDLSNQERFVACKIDLGAYESVLFTRCPSSTRVCVDSTFGDDTNAGTAWASAFKTISRALAYANDSTTVRDILIAKGTYYPTGIQSGTNRDSSFTILRDGLKLYGGYVPGGASRDLSGANEVILDGNINNSSDNLDNAYHVVVVNAAGTDSIVFDGLSFRNGYASGIGTGAYGPSLIDRNKGGGMLINNNTPSPKIYIEGCNYYNNAADTGAGFYTNSTNIVVSKSVFGGNEAQVYGGGMYVGAPNAGTVTNSIFSGNKASKGGGLAVQTGGVTLINNVFSGNNATDGGGIYSKDNMAGQPVLTNSIVWGNSNGLTDESSAPLVTNSIVQGATVYPGTGNQNADPRFVAPKTYTDAPFYTGANYRLNVCSPAVNVGDSTGRTAYLTSTDLAKNPRYNGIIDLGPYENTGDISTLSVPAVSGLFQSNAAIKQGNLVHFCDCTNDYLLLTLDTTGTGAKIPAGGASVKLETGATFYPGGTGFIAHPHGSALFNRQWNVTPATQPSSAVKVYFYYTTADFNALNDTLSAHSLTPLASENQMYFYKVTDNTLGAFPPMSSLNAGNVQVINHGASATTSFWQEGLLAGNKYASFLVSGFSGGGGGGTSGGTPLPVKLISFTGKVNEASNTLRWNTADESSLTGYEIERSKDGKNFSKWMKVPAKLNNSNNYELNDDNRFPETYYRIRIEDMSGGSFYSKTVLLVASKSATSFTVSPNPATGNIRLTFNSSELLHTVLRVYDMTGRLMDQQMIRSAEMSVDVSNYAPGNYNLVLSNGQSVQFVKVVN